MNKYFLFPIVILKLTFSCFANANNHAHMSMILERYAEMKGSNVELSACISQITYDNNEVNFKSNFIEDIYDKYKITYYYDQKDNTIHFSCHQFLKSRHFKNAPKTRDLEQNTYPLFHSRNIFGEYSVTMHEKAWDSLISVGSGSLELSSSESNLNNVVSGLEVVRFKQRNLRKETAEEIKRYLEQLSGAPVYYDELTNTFAFQQDQHTETLKNMLMELDVKVESLDIIVSFLKFSRSSIDDFLIGSASNSIRSGQIQDTQAQLNCKDQCRYQDFTDYVAKLRPASNPSSIFQLVNSGLDLEFGAIKMSTLTDDNFDFSRGKSTYYFDSKMSVEQSDVGNVFALNNTPYQIDTGLSFSGRVRNTGDQYHIEYSLSDGDENLSQSQSDISTSSQITNSSRIKIKIGDEVLATNMMISKELEEQRVMPLLGYIPFIGQIFNSTKAVKSDQHVFYYIHLSSM